MKNTIDVRVRELDKKIHSILKIEAIKQQCTFEDFIKKILTVYAEGIGD